MYKKNKSRLVFPSLLLSSYYKAIFKKVFIMLSLEFYKYVFLCEKLYNRIRRMFTNDDKSVDLS